MQVGDVPGGVRPTEPRAPISKLDFLERFTDAELGDILDAGKQVKQVAVFIKKLELSGEVRLDDPRTVAGLQALEGAGLLGPGRAALIVS